MTLGKLSLDISLLVNQATLHHRIRKELDHCPTKRIAAIENRKQSVLAGEFACHDAPHQFTATDIQGLRDAGAHICQWDIGNSTERQIFDDLPWQNIPALLDTICGSHDTLEHATVIDSIAKEPRVPALGRKPTFGKMILRHNIDGAEDALTRATDL